MSDVNAKAKRKRSVVNPLKTLNDLRKEKGLPPARKTKKKDFVKITAGLKLEVTRQVVNTLYPGALVDKDYVFDEDMSKKVAREVELKLNRIKSAKEPVPAFTEPAPAPKADKKPAAPKAVAKPAAKAAGTTDKKPAAPKAAKPAGAPKAGGLQPKRIVKGKSE